MERPTSALHLTRGTLSLRQLGAEPHTKEVGRDAVYNGHWFRSARRDDGGGGATRESSDAGTPHVALGRADDCPIRGATPSTGHGDLLLRGRSVRLRIPARADRPEAPVC